MANAKEELMKKTFTKNGRNYFVKVEGNTLYIGTRGFISNIAARLLCKEIMRPLNWTLTGSFTDIAGNGYTSVAIGYRIPLITRIFGNALKCVESIF